MGLLEMVILGCSLGVWLSLWGERFKQGIAYCACSAEDENGPFTPIGCPPPRTLHSGGRTRFPLLSGGRQARKLTTARQFPPLFSIPQCTSTFTLAALGQRP